LTTDSRSERQPDIAEYALVADCHTAALVARDGSVDWCCLPAFDSPSVFGRLLDAERGGSWTLRPAAGTTEPPMRRYLDGTLVLETVHRTPTGEVAVTDCFAMREGGRASPRRQLLRIVDGRAGAVEMASVLAPRFEYGALAAWVRTADVRHHAVLGGRQGLWICGDVEWAAHRHHLEAAFTVRAGERRVLAAAFGEPHTLDEPGSGHPRTRTPAEVDAVARNLDETIAWWLRWSERARQAEDEIGIAGVARSAITIKALTFAPTGAVVAAPTTSLPECADSGDRNWDYRFAWVRDSSWSARSMLGLGYEELARGFRRFIVRATAGSADDLQVLYGLHGENRMTEIELGDLAGYRGLGPVRVGNGAAEQLQLDMYGELVDLAARWLELGHEPDDSYWQMIHDLAAAAGERWQQRDHGLWEVRGEERHFVHSKAMCWLALDRAVRIAETTGRRAPTDRWKEAQDEIAAAIEEHGRDRHHGGYVRTFRSRHADASLLRLPMFGFIAWDDPRMVATVDAVRAELERDGLVWRYREADKLEGDEGAFLACTFWLAECLARQGRTGDARSVFERACATANDVGLFSEEFDPAGAGMLGNFPQALTHFSHLSAAGALGGLPAEDSTPAS
jgi:GH15 family glucan-1,4-alpha-glucosidase